MQFSLLLSLYNGEKASNFEQAMDSVVQSTRQPDEVVLVLDGPVRPELNELVECYRSLLSMVVVPLEQNVGLGKALNIGLQQCSYSWVARFDTDDINEPNRFALQLGQLERDPQLDIIGSLIAEFSDDPQMIRSYRAAPETHAEIVKYGQRRNPFNHMTVMYRKEAVLRCGGYGNEYFYEDYALWVRLLLSGAKGMNIQQPLVRARTDSSMYRRRGGWRYARQEVATQYTFYRLGFIGAGRFLLNCVQRTPARLLPPAIREWIYLKLLR